MRREEWNRKYAETGLLWSATPNRAFAAEVADLAPGIALDLACGEGRNAIWLAGLGWRVTAVDFSEVAIEKARRMADEQGVEVAFVCADLLDFEPEPGAFDLVAVLYLQLPSAELRTVLSRAVGALAAGGTFVLVGHDLANLEEGVGGPSDPEVLYTADDIVAGLQGLEIEKAERVHREIEGEDRPAIDVLVRAYRPPR